MTRSADHGNAPTPAPPRRRDGILGTRGAQTVGAISIVMFLIVLLCFIVGFLGMTFDPSVREQWGGLHYLFLMALPAMFLCPIGLILGLVGLGQKSVLPGIGVVLNGLALLLWLMFRFALR